MVGPPSLHGWGSYSWGSTEWAGGGTLSVAIPTTAVGKVSIVTSSNIVVGIVTTPYAVVIKTSGQPLNGWGSYPWGRYEWGGPVSYSPVIEAEGVIASVTLGEGQSSLVTTAVPI